ncbi:pleiotropic ABC efflux transporter of multiple drugs [Kluyveromyces marxianus DMKU3-1042]|uniref:Pleiotropic ABC efflux transporter of multiple drugs n=1 Tax=Kluyveromyces marxianus (strain DMKU3-1042 / BCC 29191 / NBRC 104275) TaxID=1003335 RepID=W0TDS2_KLUMD|nr:pleiotropic drug resistance family protein [Kluyveromyces marxianus DMKU3-1042]BAO40269.1 pleiotropic ABC efflux transporter of multiple drugs [Kluyveromyces marxianus DMKU3-1042]
METDSSSSKPDGYHGLDSKTEEHIKALARTLSRTSLNRQISLQASGNGASKFDEVKSIFSSSYSGVNPVFLDPSAPGYDARLDPNSEHFSSAAWVKNMVAFSMQDPDYYKHYTIGCCWKDLRAFGDSNDVSYQSTVTTLPGKYLGKIKRHFTATKEEDVFDILKPMDGLVKPGELLVVLGRPGAGCSTLLKTISANVEGYSIDPNSTISYNGLDPKVIKKHFRGEVVYNAEGDIHFPHLTVYETLNIVALLATPSNRIKGVSREEFAKHITEVAMATYGLSHTKNTKVGGDLVRGVSGGERKRVSIAEVTICGSKFQCWDNATRGLDSATALEFIRALKTSTDISGSTAVIAIYQCSQDAYDLFDKVCVLDEGYQIFFGYAKDAKKYFENMGYVSPARQTTADFLTAVTNPAERIVNQDYVKEGRFIPSTAKEMEEYWRNSPEYKQLHADIEEELSKDSAKNFQQLQESHVAKQSKGQRKGSPYIVNYRMQVKYLTIRNIMRIKRSFSVTLGSIFGNIFMSLILGSIFYKSMKHTNTNTFFYRGAAMFTAVLFNSFSSMLEIFTLYEARPITEKHKRYSLYHPSADALASMMSELPAKIVTAICFNLILYFMANFRREPGPFFFYFMMSFLATLVMSSIFRCIGAAAKTLSEAMVPSSILLLAISLYVGFSVPKKSLLGWSKWIWYINPVSYVFESLMINEFNGRDFPCAVFIPSGPGYENVSATEKVCNTVGSKPGLPYVSGKDFIVQSYGYDPSHRWRGFGIALAYFIFFSAVYLLFCEYNESAVQKGEILVFPKAVLKKAKKEALSRPKSDVETGEDPEGGITDRKLLQDSQEDSNESVDEKQSAIALEKSGAIFHWRNVCYDVQIKKETRRILSNVDGWVKPGTLTALMGSSGAGKTTLLDCLASRVTMGVITGDMFVNGHLRDNSFPRSIGYCQQQDLHLSTATVRESLRFSAYLRQPSSVSIEDKNRYVEHVIRMLGMEKYADAVVGVTGEGLNVEQRKRLTIGVELAARPKLLLFLDEPTSGLDSQTAWSVCQLMRKLADHGQAILCTIHQPSALLMQEFDRLLFLQKGGKTVYFGDLGHGCQTMIDYFERNGAHKCPEGANPAEWMLEVIGAAPGSSSTVDYHEVWRNSEEYRMVQKELDWMEVELAKKPMDTTEEQNEFATSLPYQFKIVTTRLFQQYWRTPSYIWSKAFLTVFSQIFIGFTFFKAKLTLQGLQNQMFATFTFTIIFNPACQQYLPLFVSQRDLYEARERPSRTFSWLAFIYSQIIVEIPFNILLGTVAFFVFYYPVGFYNNASYAGQLHERGVLFWLFCVEFYIYISSMAQLCIAGLEHAESAGNISSILFTMSLMFCGVFGGPGVLPKFWNFMYRVSPLTYFIDGLLSTGLANTKAVCADYEYVHFNPKSGQTCGKYLANYIKAFGGYLANPDATNDCSYCKISESNTFLQSFKSSYHKRWRNFGIFLVFIVFDWAACMFLYWLARVPKKKNRVSNERNPDKLNNQENKNKEEV